MVASTELLAALGDVGFEALRRRLFLALRRVARHGGVEVKNLGDGLMVSFASVVDAVDCAVATQREMRRAGRPTGLRVELAVGEAMVDGDDFFGTPVVEAARLCGVAQGGQILATDVVRVLAAERGARFVSVGRLELKGVPEPLAAVEVRWEDRAATEFPLPAALSTTVGLPFTGRGRGALDASMEGGCGLEQSSNGAGRWRARHRQDAPRRRARGGGPRRGGRGVVRPVR